jgi:nitrite reductase/ring-hydroxylating ferredoxin subunit
VNSQAPGIARGFPTMHDLCMYVLCMCAARAFSPYTGSCSAQSCTRLTTTFTASFIH